MPNSHPDLPPRRGAFAAVGAATAKAVERFPLVVAAGVVAAICASIAIGHGEHPEAFRLAAATTLALPLLFAVTVLGEQRRATATRPMMFAFALAMLAAFWWRWPAWTNEIQAYRYFQLSLAFHAFAAFSPFIRSGGTNGFWQYNKALFLRALTAAIYTGVLYVGLAIALAAVERLFNIRLPEATFARLWFVLVFVFSTCFFVGGVPEDVAGLETLSDYPNVLRAFTQFVLVPLIAVYLAILMLYLGKVVLTQEWPNGWIGYLVSSVAVVGILAWLLVHPLEERAEFRWVKPFTKGFYIALMPAIVMLWLATWKRVHAYGITERRYFLIVLSVWLAAVAVYYTFSRSRNIKLIPASLCLLALVTFAGPTGAYSVSRTNQMSRLRAVLERNGLLVNDRLQRSTRSVPDSDRVAISAGFRYMIGTHGVQPVSAWLSDSLRRVFDGRKPTTMASYSNREDDARAVMASINVEYVTVMRTATTGGGGSVYFVAPSLPVATPIAGYQYALHVNLRPTADSVRIDDRTMLRLSANDATLHLLRDGASVLDVPLQPAVDSERTAAQATVPALRLEAQNGQASVLIFLTQLTGTKTGGKLSVTYLSGEIFLKMP
jgi:hypothetical protein